jgi:hypothetical protein
MMVFQAYCFLLNRVCLETSKSRFERFLGRLESVIINSEVVTAKGWISSGAMP